MARDHGTADATTIGQLLDGLTPQRVRQLAAEGVIPRAERGRYPIVGAVQGYIRYLKTETRASRGKEDDDRFRRARAEVHEIAAAERRGALVPVEMMSEQIVEVFVAFTSKLDALAPRIAGYVPAKVRASARAQIDDEIRDLRRQLAGGLAKYCSNLEARARRRESAAAKDAGRVGGQRARPAARKRRARPVSK